MKRIVLALLSLSLIFSAFIVPASAADKPLYGDVNSDGAINMKDVLAYRKYIAGMSVKFDESVADVAVDGKVNMKDVLLMRKYIAGMDVVLGPTEPTIDYSSKTYSLSSVSDKITRFGRSAFEKSALRCDFTNSGFEFTANCEGDVTIRLSNINNGGYMGVVIDDDYDNMTETFVDSSMTRWTVASGLEKGEHKIRIIKLNEFNIYTNGSHATFKSIALNGEIVKNKPVEKSLKIEFYGDSLTCGYGNLTTNGTANAGSAKYENGMKTFAVYAAKELDADFSICAGSGHGIYCSNMGSKTGTVATIMDKAIDEANDKSWDYSYDADIAVITLGTNDLTASSSGVEITQEDIATAAKALVDKIRLHNPDCKILWLTGITGQLKNSKLDIDSELAKLAESTDNMTYYNGLTRSQSGGDGHPTVEQHQKLGQEVAALIRDIMK